MTHHKGHHKPHEPQPTDADAGAAQPQPASPEPASMPPPQAADAPQALQAQRDDLLARLQRVSADYLNYQKRAQRDVAQAREFANDELIRSLLPVLDDMERALSHARENHPADDPLLVGMELVHQKAMEAMGRFGLTAIKAQGQPFDPDHHQALMEQPSDEYPPRTVIKELQTGYQLKGRTIRPAKVVVSKEPEPSPPPAPEEPE